MHDPSQRPFYGEYAWAYDLLIERPVARECSAIEPWFTERGILPGADVLDAGCGTGRYSTELARRGYVVHGIDLSPKLIDEAERSVRDSPVSVSFTVGDIAALPATRYDGILCRGVLNDVLDDAGRRGILAAFSRALRPGGVLICDVREWEGSAARKLRESVFRKRVATERGTLTFKSVTEVDSEHRSLIVSERHTLLNLGRRRTSDYAFVMRCWTGEELQSILRLSGFEDIAFFGAYDTRIECGSTDRIVTIAHKSEAAGLRTR